MNFVKSAVAAAAFVTSFAGSANATISTIYTDILSGVATFTATATGAGATVSTDTLTGLVNNSPAFNRPGYTITRVDGEDMRVRSYGTMSGDGIKIDPALNAGLTEPSGTRLSPESYMDSGIQFTFTSPINAIGFEVGDWGTCCKHPTTDLFISFDGGAPILVASANGASDPRFPSQTTGSLVYEIFVAAFDDSGSFTTVTFWGNGLNERLDAGGALRYALLDEGSLPAVPLPAGAVLMLGGLAALGGLKARRKQARA